jgi:hypothetical protein
MKQLSVFLFFALLSPSVHCQSKKVFSNTTLHYSELANILDNPKWDTIIFENVSFTADLGKRVWNDSIYGESYISNVIEINNAASIEFIECNFSTSVAFEGKHHGDVSFEKCKGEELVIQNCNIRESWIWESSFTRVLVEHSTYKNLYINAKDTQIILFKVKVDTGKVNIAGNQIHIEKSNFILHGDESLIENKGEGNPWTNVLNSNFYQLDSGFLQFEQNNGFIRIRHSYFGGSIDLFGDENDVTWDLVDNTFKRRVGFRSVAEIGPASYLNFKEIFQSKLLGWHIKENNINKFYDGSGQQISNERHYLNLLRLHKRLHNFYIEGGDMQTANILYTRLKDLETNRLIYNYEQSPSFDLWVRITLNRLLKFYTRYGTDPARAILISIWIVFIFGILYIFFPSSWDLATRAKLIGSLQDYKNSKEGRHKILFGILIGVLAATLNALTLSINSFVTLGFGEIPTKGVARYLTIFEGVLGWFLLALFSVALINQSIF